MARPTVSAAAERLFASLGPWARADGDTTGWVLLHLCHALTQSIQDVDVLAADTDTTAGWSVALDPTNAPVDALPWLAQFVGVVLPPGVGAAAQRAAIIAHAGFQRGTLAALGAAIQEQLTGAKSYFIQERYPDAYGVLVQTYAAQTPDPAAVTAAVDAALPAGIVATVQLLSGWNLGQMKTHYTGMTLANLKTDYTGQTLNDLRGTPP